MNTEPVTKDTIKNISIHSVLIYHIKNQVNILFSNMIKI